MELIQNQVEAVPDFRRLDVLCDELGIIRRLLEKPEIAHPPQVMDVTRMAIQYTHMRFEELAHSMRLAASSTK